MAASTQVGVLSHVADQLQVAWPLHVAQSPHVAVWQVGERQVTVPEHVVHPWHDGSFQQVGAQSHVGALAHDAAPSHVTWPSHVAIPAHEGEPSHVGQPAHVC